MGASAGLALKGLQWFFRLMQFLCAAVVLALYSYFLATLHNHDLAIANWVRAVEGISGAACLYTLIGLLLLCCLAGHPFTAFFAILVDTAFVGAFIYVAIQNRYGAGSCEGTVTTPFGTANADTNVSDDGNTGFTALPSFHTACKMESACLAVSIVAVFLFLFSGLTELALVRHRRKEQRFGPSPANNYTSGYGKKRGFNFFGLGRKRRATDLTDPNVLPEHTHPEQVRTSYATEQTRVGTAHGGGATAQPEPVNPYKWEPKYTHDSNAIGTAQSEGIAPAHYPPANYRYDDGVFRV